MDRLERTINIAKTLNSYNTGKLEPFQFVRKVCDYFDFLKDEELSSSDKKFLIHLANKAGIPQYYDMLSRFNGGVDLSLLEDELSLQSLSSLLYESSLFSYTSKLHKYQKQILDKFSKEKQNRFFLSASTSFGKTHIVYDIIRKMEYKNVVLIFPTIALLSENLEKILSENPEYSYFRENYKVHTLSEVSKFAERNLFIYTPERFLSFLEKNPNANSFDFAFVDEVYKIDNEYIIDEETKENERDTAYRLAVFYSLDKNTDALLAGPYIEFSKKDDLLYNNSFDNFLAHNQIELINFNDFEIVDKTFNDIISNKNIEIDSDLGFNFSNSNKTQRLIEAVHKIAESKQNVIVYCPDRGRRSGVEKYINDLIKSELFNNHSYIKYEPVITHISSNFPNDWIVISALKHGFGIHHGLIPKYIQKEIVQLFNQGLLHTLLSTTTITEGVNTSAKNLIVLQNKKGDKALRKFDAKNIAGRAGRFGYHYHGRVLALDKSFLETIESIEDGIKHKNYDKNAIKKEIDLFYTKNEFLTPEDAQKKTNIKIEQEKRGIPDEIIGQYKVVSRNDKIIVYDRISELTSESFENLNKLFYAISVHTSISFEGFEVVLSVLRPIIKNQELERMIDTLVFNKRKQREFPLLCSLVYAYLESGFSGSIEYKKNVQDKDTDSAISETAKFVYNTLKYQVVKYLGVFNIMYKFRISQITGKQYNDINGLDKLLLKFEYNALTDEGRIVSDYGVPVKVLEYFENKVESKVIKENFDSYELSVFEKVSKIVEANNK